MCDCGKSSGLTTEQLRDRIYTAKAYLSARNAAGGPCDPGPMIPCTADAELCCLEARLRQLECLVAANGDPEKCTACNIGYKVDVDECKGIKP